MNTVWMDAPPDAPLDVPCSSPQALPAALMDQVLARVLPAGLPRRPARPEQPLRLAGSAPTAAAPACPPVTPAALQARVAQLPPLPEAVLAMVATLDNGQASIGQVVDVLQRDQALTARVLRLANSAFYGVPGRVASVHGAVNLIGLRSLRSLVATAALPQQFPHAADSGFDLGLFWRHSVAAAFAARAIAARHGLDEEMAYTACLLHDAGQLALAAHFQQAHALLLQGFAEFGHGCSSRERQLIGIDHAEVGAVVAAHWHLPAPVVAVIARHHQPPEPAQSCSLVDVAHVADALAHALGYGHGDGDHAPRLQAGPWHRVGLERMPVHDIVAQVEGAVADTCSALGL